MRILFFLATLLGVSVQPQAQAAEAKRYRWFPRMGRFLPALLNAKTDLPDAQPLLPSPIVVSPPDGPQFLPAKGETVRKGPQMAGAAVVDGTWTQTIFHPDGHVLYAAGAVFDELPGDEWLGRTKKMQAEEAEATRVAASLVSDYATSPRKSAPQLRLRQRAEGGFELYWRMEYASAGQDELRFLCLGEKGELLETGLVAVSGAEGKAMVYPQGPRWSALTEVPLLQLQGDGTLSNRAFRVTSALNLDVRSPNLLFFFPETDRRFDLSQVYFTMERSLRWMHDFLGAELRDPLEVRLHIGENGVSNAAFYHEDVIYLGTGDGVSYKDLSRDPSVVTHESVHAMIDSYVGLPSQGEGGSFNEGFADFFTALMLKNPRMGDSSFLKGPYRRTLENDFKAFRDFNDGTYRNGSIIAGTLWDLRPVLSDERLAQLAFRTLVRLGAGARFEDFVPSLRQAALGFLSAEETALVEQKVRERGWKVDP